MSELELVIQNIADTLKRSQRCLVTAESCTGGLIASSLTQRAGSSAWFERGFVTYSNIAKQDMLGVPEALIIAHGAVSEEVALAMALGALKHSQSQVALSVTGIAGPGGGTTNKPVGTVCFAWAIQNQLAQKTTQYFQGTRNDIRLAASDYALKRLLEYLNTPSS